MSIGSSHRPKGLFAPNAGALFGAFTSRDPQWSGPARAEASVRALEKKLGRRLAIDSHYYAFTDSFPTQTESFDASQGRLPLVNWGGADLKAIASGRFDALIAQRADALAAFGKPVLLRWGWEMNGDWSTWDGAHNGDADGARLYVKAWRRIHDIFRKHGATNVAFVWSPNASDVPARSWNHWLRYYPGDRYVDWVGIDGYSWGGARGSPSLASIMAPLYRDFARRKPILIAETAAAQGPRKQAYIRQLGADLPRQFPSVAGVVWFDQKKERDWRVDSSPQALAAMRAVAKSSYFEASPSPAKQ